MKNSCNDLFEAGKLTWAMDGGAGSSGKAKLGSYLMENQNKVDFVCNTFAPQAGHWTETDDGRRFFYQTLNSCAYNPDLYKKMYIGPGSIIELSALLKEIKENKIPKEKLGISPIIPILDIELDQAFEKGELGFDGTPLEDGIRHDGTNKKGSTAHGVGSCMARRVLRRPSLKTAADIPELQDYLCDVPREIMARLDNGECGFFEVAQGFQLSLLYDTFFGYTTSRNVTMAQAMSDMFLPTKYLGQGIINFRTFPIRINNNKFLCTQTGRHLTWDEVQNGMPHEVLVGNSGPMYADQKEMTWDEVTESAGSPEKIFECTSVTKLPRRVFSFSKENVSEAVKFNDTGHRTWISMNFMNYVDHSISGASGVGSNVLPDKINNWMNENIPDHLLGDVRFLGTGPKISEMLEIH